MFDFNLLWQTTSVSVFMYAFYNYIFVGVLSFIVIFGGHIHRM